jgi:hypothetical protein
MIRIKCLIYLNKFLLNEALDSPVRSFFTHWRKIPEAYMANSCYHSQLLNILYLIAFHHQVLIFCYMAITRNNFMITSSSIAIKYFWYLYSAYVFYNRTSESMYIKYLIQCQTLCKCTNKASFLQPYYQNIFSSGAITSKMQPVLEK